MKIRILGNSLRLRLSQSEVRQLKEEGLVSEQISFGGEAANQLVYSIKKTAVTAMWAHFSGNQMVVEVPEQMADDWANSNAVSLLEQMPLGEEEALKILVEKDFKCLTEREGEEEGDLFPNPEEDKAC